MNRSTITMGPTFKDRVGFQFAPELGGSKLPPPPVLWTPIHRTMSNGENKSSSTPVNDGFTPTTDKPRTKEQDRINQQKARGLGTLTGAPAGMKFSVAPDDGKRIQGGSYQDIGLDNKGGLNEFYAMQEHRDKPAFYQGSASKGPVSVQELASEAIEEGKRYTTDGLVEAREQGGPVNAGQPYLVGEKGPEIVVPKQSGTVIPSVQTLAELAEEQSGPIMVNGVPANHKTGQIAEYQGPKSFLELASSPPAPPPPSRPVSPTSIANFTSDDGAFDRQGRTAVRRFLRTPQGQAFQFSAAMQRSAQSEEDAREENRYQRRRADATLDRDTELSRADQDKRNKTLAIIEAGRLMSQDAARQGIIPPELLTLPDKATTPETQAMLYQWLGEYTQEEQKRQAEAFTGLTTQRSEDGRYEVPLFQTKKGVRPAGGAYPVPSSTPRPDLATMQKTLGPDWEPTALDEHGYPTGWQKVTTKTSPPAKQDRDGNWYKPDPTTGNPVYVDPRSNGYTSSLVPTKPTTK